MDQNDYPVSHTDLYHKLGKLEGLIETMMSSFASFQTSIKDLHTRIDAVEARQSMLESRRASEYGGTHALIGLAKDFAIPVMAITVAWLISREKNAQPAIPAVPYEHHQLDHRGKPKALSQVP
jgi:D-arabinose 1-dehydrogenase-like Zn-dependent alcohol dehydrogenase